MSTSTMSGGTVLLPPEQDNEDAADHDAGNDDAVDYHECNIENNEDSAPRHPMAGIFTVEGSRFKM
jgi:hypothetical protein